MAFDKDAREAVVAGAKARGNTVHVHEAQPVHGRRQEDLGGAALPLALETTGMQVKPPREPRPRIERPRVVDDCEAGDVVELLIDFAPTVMSVGAPILGDRWGYPVRADLEIDYTAGGPVVLRADTPVLAIRRLRPKEWC